MPNNIYDLKEIIINEIRLSCPETLNRVLNGMQFEYFI